MQVIPHSLQGPQPYTSIDEGHSQQGSAGAAAVASVGESILAKPIDSSISTDHFAASKRESSGWDKLKEAAKAVGNLFLAFIGMIGMGTLCILNMGMELTHKALDMCRTKPQNLQVIGIELNPDNLEPTGLPIAYPVD